MKISLAVLLVALALAASSQSTCPSRISTQWIANGLPVSVQCEGASSGMVRWWAVADPCSPDPSATQLGTCSGGRCDVGRDVYGGPSTCFVCCTSDGSSGYNPALAISCTNISVCPTATPSARTEALTGTTVEVQTVVRMKPRPRGDGITVSAHVSGQPLPVHSDNIVYSNSSENNSYVFVHVIEMPQSKLTESDEVFSTVDFRGLEPHGSCEGRTDKLLRIKLIQANISTSTLPTVTMATSNGSTSSPTFASPMPTGAVLDAKSLGIGIGIGAGAGIVVTGVAMALIFVLVGRCRHGCCRRKMSSPPSATGNERPLLTQNMTPANTPCSDAPHILGQTTNSTPASTPTDSKDLFLTQQSNPSSSDGSPYEEVAKNGFPPQSTIMQRTGPPTMSPARSAPPPPIQTSYHPPPQQGHPAPFHQAPPPPLPLGPRPPKMEHSGEKKSILLMSSDRPGYITQNDIIYLRSGETSIV